MTDILEIASDAYDDIKQQYTIEDVYIDDLAKYVKRAIISLYNLSNRGDVDLDEKFGKDEQGVYISFEDTLNSIEKEWVTYEAEIIFYKGQRAGYTEAKGYSTDAMTVTHADRPFKNMSDTISELEGRKNVLFTRLYSRTILGVSG